MMMVIDTGSEMRIGLVKWGPVWRFQPMHISVPGDHWPFVCKTWKSAEVGEISGKIQASD